MNCVLDKNLLIYCLNDAIEPAVSEHIAQMLRASARFSVITRMEVLEAGEGVRRRADGAPDTCLINLTKSRLRLSLSNA
jgi:hypothetical protein